MSLSLLLAAGLCACSSGDIGSSNSASSSGATTTGTGGAGGMSGSTKAVAVSVTGVGGGGGSGSGGAPGLCPNTLVMTYDVTGQIAITDTPLGAGDTVQNIGPGTMKIRFQNNNGQPIEGFTQVVSFHMPIKFQVDNQGVLITTDVTVDAGTDECGVASGLPVGYDLKWNSCQYDPMTWTIQQAGTGPGCLHGYHTTGNVNCNNMSSTITCTDVNLMDGDNPQDTTWDQPLNTFVFATDLKSFQMRDVDGPPAGDKGVEFPNDFPGRTWINLDAVETSRMVEKTPDCACPP